MKPRNKLSPFIRGFLDIYTVQKLSITFGGFIHADRASLLWESDSSQKNGTTFSYIVPKHLCRGRNGIRNISAGAVLALFDEFSSQSFMVSDKLHRPGVSISLSCKILKSCQEGSKVQFVSIPKKIGNIIGFCDMFLLSEDGEVLATGTHIKYLPMGWFWSIFIGNWLVFPIFVTISQMLANKPRSHSAGQSSARVETISVEESFNLERIDASSFSFTVKMPQYCNGMGTLHGGAMAVAADMAAVRLLEEEEEEEEGRLPLLPCESRIFRCFMFALSHMFLAGGMKEVSVASMDIQYLSAVKVE